MRVLEELWNGNIEPSEYDTSPCKDALQLVSVITASGFLRMWLRTLTMPIRAADENSFTGLETCQALLP